MPWVAQPEKVADITRVIEANPDQKFVHDQPLRAKADQLLNRHSGKTAQLVRGFITGIHVVGTKHRRQGQVL